MTVGAHDVAADARRDAVGELASTLDPRAVPELRARFGRLLGEERVEAAALRHPDQRLRVAAREARAVAQPQLEAVDVVLDDRATDRRDRSARGR